MFTFMDGVPKPLNRKALALRSVMFNFLGRDFFNALAEKDADRFAEMLVKWLVALCAGIPVFVFRDYYQVSLPTRGPQFAAVGDKP